MQNWKELEVYEEGVTILEADTIYVCIHPIELPEFVKKIPIHHGPIRKRGKGKVNRDWEK